MNATRPLKDMLEDIILNPKELDRLKQLITQIESGKSNGKILRERILKSRIDIIHELIQFFPFYAQYSINASIQPDMDRALQERDELLYTLAQRLHYIREQLESSKL